MACIAGALERRVWTVTTDSRMFPNMFVLFVAPPGVGKDRAIDPMRKLWKDTGVLKVAPTALTHKGLMDELADSKSTRIYTDASGKVINFHSLLIAAPELGVILPEYDLAYLSMFNELFMCYDVFEERIRGRAEPLRIAYPHIHFVAGTQPKYLYKFLPTEAFGMGFTSRVMLVYAGEGVRVSLFGSRKTDAELEKDLLHDLKQITEISGEYTFSPEARDAIEAWHMYGCEEDAPTHTRLSNYLPRRIIHVLKLCMVFAASRTNTLTIELEDFQAAHALLLETEALMPQIFREMVSDTNQTQVEEAFNYIVNEFVRHDQKPVPEHRVIHFLAARVPLNQIAQLIDVMLNAGMLRQDLTSVQAAGRRLLIPVSLGVSKDL